MSDEHRYCARCGKPAQDGQFQWSAPPQPRVAQPPRRLERDMYNRKVAGVCSGFAAYFNMDPTIMRLIWVGLFFATGLPIVVYPICWIVMSRNDMPPRLGPAYQNA
jgi:phage shock protein PspC (stress-responsive transcriptional regulator)